MGQIALGAKDKGGYGPLVLSAIRDKDHGGLILEIFGSSYQFLETWKRIEILEIEF